MRMFFLANKVRFRAQECRITYTCDLRYYSATACVGAHVRETLGALERVRLATPFKFNMAPENHLLDFLEDISFENHHFQDPC